MELTIYQKTTLITGAFFLVIVLGFIDRQIGPLIALDIFYLIPIGIVAWFSGRYWGVIIAMCAVALWFTSDRRVHLNEMNFWILIWNLSSEIILYVGFALLIDSIHRRVLLLHELANLDPLTRVANRRAFYVAASMEQHRAQRYKNYFTIAYLDIDNFKHVNDTYGHNTGDQLLRDVTKFIKENTREADTVARIGGDEIVILFPEIDENQAEVVIEKLRQGLNEKVRIADKPITYSIGVITFRQAPGSFDLMMKMVDDLMYTAKTNGKNSVRYSIFSYSNQ